METSEVHPSEPYVLGTLMNFGEGFENCEKLDSRNFSERRFQLVWQAILELFESGKPYTADCVHAVLFRDDKLEEAGGIEFIDWLMQRGVSPATLHVHAGDLTNRRLVREVANVAHRISLDATEDANAGTLIEHADREFTALQMQRETRSEVSAKAMAIDVMRGLEERSKNNGITGLSSGFADLDEQTNGLQNGALIILAARPAMGKTALALNIAGHLVLKAKTAVAFFSLEMGAAELGQRMLASASRVELERARGNRFSDADRVRLATATGDIACAPLTVVDASLLTINELRSHARKLKAQGKLSLLVVDYLQLMTADAQNREREIGEISRGLKMLAKELAVPVMALSQLNRGVESRPEKRPTLADLRDSGSIEQDADSVWFLYRDEVYNPQTPDKGFAEVIIAKNRNGPCGKVRLRFAPEIQRFTQA